MTKQKDPFDEIVDELVVFRHEDPNAPEGEYFSNNPMWNDSRVREAWLAKYADKPEADPDDEDEEIPDDPDDDYENWTNDELRAELSNRKLSVDGKKSDLVGRLREYDDQHPPQ
jgi:hypothetical protein